LILVVYNAVVDNGNKPLDASKEDENGWLLPVLLFDCIKIASTYFSNLIATVDE
jgi:hypothetical protein